MPVQNKPKKIKQCVSNQEHLFSAFFLKSSSTFCLNAKSSKKIKAAVIAPRTQPCQRTTKVIIVQLFILIACQALIMPDTAGAGIAPFIISICT